MRGDPTESPLREAMHEPRGYIPFDITAFINLVERAAALLHLI